MIKIGENPQGTVGINKFIGIEGEGLREKIIAMHKSKKKAIVLCMNTGILDPAKWGALYLINENTESSYPVVVKCVMEIPDEKGWSIV